jgi:hypothetical protein
VERQRFVELQKSGPRHQRARYSLLLRGKKGTELEAGAAVMFAVYSQPALAEDPFLVASHIFGYSLQSDVGNIGARIGNGDGGGCSSLRLDV